MGKFKEWDVTNSEDILSGTLLPKTRRKQDRKRKKKDEIDSIVDTVLKKNEKQIDKDAIEDSALKARLEKYSRGEGIDLKDPGIRNKTLKQKILDKDEDIKFSESFAGRTEVLQGETQGYIEAEDGLATRTLSQGQIKKAVDITSASKQFDLALMFGPYRLDYSRNGRHLLLGGKRGHVAAFDWVTKQLMCEINVMESVFDVQWLHVETMFAVAQKEWTYVYNNQGVELHCIQDIHRPLRLEFLPYHFLLAACTEVGCLKWLDVTMGKVVASYNSYRGRMAVLTQNPYNAILCTGHSNGTVCMWSPNMKKPVASMLCHKSNVQAIAIDHTGNYMGTSACQRDLKVWDVRQLCGPLQSYKLVGGSASDLAFSQSGLLAASCANTVQIFKDCAKEAVAEPYLVHRTRSPIQNIEFCPYEDILGLASNTGFTSMLVPGAGEANFDALEVNPLRSKKQRQETEVRSLLDKIPVEMISLDPSVLSEVDLPTLQQKWEAKRKILYARAPDINFTPRNKKKQGKSLRRDQVKRIIQQDAKKAFYNKIGNAKGKILEGNKDEETGIQRKKSVLDRFRTKQTTRPTSGIVKKSFRRK